MTRVISHSDCPAADLIVDAVYEGGQTKDAGSDAISKVTPGSGNQGGFRAAGTGDDKKFRPSRLEHASVQYFGDDKTPGHEAGAIAYCGVPSETPSICDMSSQK
jgi:hypothetical protein